MGSAKIRKPHRFVTAHVEQVRRNLQERKRFNKRGNQAPLREPTELEERTLRMWDALLKALDKRAYDLSMARGSGLLSFVDLRAEPLAARLFVGEHVMKKRRAATDEDRRGNVWPSKWVEERTPTGLLSISLHENRSGGVRKEWRESVDRPMEATIDEVVEGISAAIEEVRQREEQYATAQRLQWEENNRRREALDERDRAVALRQRLVDLSAEFHAVRGIRDFIQAMTESPVSQRVGFERWRTWALQQVDILDPLLREDATRLEVSDQELWAFRDRQR